MVQLMGLVSGEHEHSRSSLSSHVSDENTELFTKSPGSQAYTETSLPASPVRKGQCPPHQSKPQAGVSAEQASYLARNLTAEASANRTSNGTLTPFLGVLARQPTYGQATCYLLSVM